MASNNGKPPKEWVPFFDKANIRADDLAACKSNKAKSIKIGLFLSPKVGRAVPIEVKGRTGKAVLRVEEGRAKEKRYYFVVTWDDKAVDIQKGSKKLPKKDKKKQEQAPQKKAPKKQVKANKTAAAMKETRAKNKRAEGHTKGNDEDW